MDIDWFTVSAQVVNFLILVWLMKRFLYRPILDAIDAREGRIAAELADAEAKRVEAQKEREEYRKKNEAFDDRRASLLATATNEANVARQRWLDEARAAADAMSAQRRDLLDREQKGLNDEITRRTREEVFAIARKALSDLAGVNLEARICEVFTQRLRSLTGEAKDRFAKGLAVPGPAVVRSAFTLPTDLQIAIRHALGETFSVNADIRFETSSDVIGGIELNANGHKVAWSIAEYLGSLSKSVRELLPSPSEAITGPSS